NRGAIERVRYLGSVPFGIREVRAHRLGFMIDFTGPVDPLRAGSPDQYTLSCYRRIHHGGYQTPGQDRPRPAVARPEGSSARRSVPRVAQRPRPTSVTHIAVGDIPGGKARPFPAIAYYTLTQVPKD